VFLNQVSFDGTHLLWTLLDSEKAMEEHPVTPMVRLFAPGGEFKFTPVESHEVIAAWRSGDMYEIIVVKHVEPHATEAEQALCNEHPCALVIGGEVRTVPYNEEAALLEAAWALGNLVEEDPTMVFEKIV